jgi:hypothetical protein
VDDQDVAVRAVEHFRAHRASERSPEQPLAASADDDDVGDLLIRDLGDYRAGVATPFDGVDLLALFYEQLPGFLQIGAPFLDL